VGAADYPTEKIAENSRKFRQLAWATQLGRFIDGVGLAYESDEGGPGPRRSPRS